jgi:hypothetical protein
MFATFLRNPATWPTDPTFIYDEDTYFYIVFDASGSMQQARPSVVWMRKHLLKNTLLSYYNNNETEFNNKALIIDRWGSGCTMPVEQTFREGVFFHNQSNRYVSVVFQDEADDGITWGYHGNNLNYTNAQLLNINTDLELTHNHLKDRSRNNYRGILMAIESLNSVSSIFNQTMNGIFDGAIPFNGGFEPNRNLRYYKDEGLVSLKSWLEYRTDSTGHEGGRYYYRELMKVLYNTDINIVAGEITFNYTGDKAAYIFFELDGTNYPLQVRREINQVILNTDHSIGIGNYNYRMMKYIGGIGSWEGNYIPITLTTEDQVINI